MTPLETDVLIIGAGSNGLEAGAYLSKAGVKVLALEKRYEMGGGLLTEEVTFPGYIHNTHAIYMMMADYAPLYKDLALESYNVKHIHPSLQFCLPLSDGRSVRLYSDVEKTCDSFAEFSKQDAKSYKELYDVCQKCVDEFIAPATYAPPLSIVEAVTKMQATESGRTVMEEYETIFNGELSLTARFNCCFPSIHDPSQVVAPAPPGRQTGLISTMAPYDLKEGGKDRWYNYKFKQEYINRYLEGLAKYAPNITKDQVLWTYISTPIDIENKLSNMRKGGFKAGLYHPLQMGYNRPNDECSSTVTPIKNLYVGGASTYPGGCVIWGPGYNVANRVAEDLGIEKWWKEPNMVTEAKKLGLL